MVSRQGSYFQPTNQRYAYLIFRYQNRVHAARAVVQLVNILNCLEYDWTVKDDWKVS